ncbi:hypothetical protein PIROE2DRAFT_14998 [Piromyces sp. E2]|nr:hypothetical protein PIROE2DRAFT_14998 [Piromyces sp. E2]|eukprot:OUM59472.1 hypothetical protein PIROE2DRAFT_14998 [Piromyces sp. E2]
MGDSSTGSNSAISEIIDQIGLFNCNTDIKICVSTVGYIKTTEAGGEEPIYYKINGSTNEVVEPSSECTSSEIGNLLTTGKLCSSKENIPMENTNSDYILSKPSSEESVFNVFKEDDILLNISENLMVFDNLFFANTYVADNGKIIDVSNMTNDGDLSIHSCSNGFCNNEEGYIKDKDSNYYTASSDGSSSLVDPKSLINPDSCNRNNVGKLTTEYKLCIGDDIVDFTMNGEDPKYYIINENDDKKGVIYVDSNLIINRKFSTDQIFITENRISLDIETTAPKDGSNLEIYSCSQSGSCINMEGFIKDINSEYYKVLADGTSSKILPSDLIDSCDEDNAGKLIKESYDLCLGYDTTAFIDTNGISTNYIIKEENINKFVFSSKQLFIKGIIKGSLTFGGNAIDTNISSPTVITKNSYSSYVSEALDRLALYNCDSSITKCISTIGYVKTADNTYYKVDGKSNSKIITFENCSSSDNVGSLSSDGKLCIVGDSYHPVKTEMDYQYIGNYLISKPSSINSVFNKFSDQEIYVYVSPNNIIYNNNFETVLNTGYNVFNIDPYTKAITPVTETSNNLYIYYYDGINLNLIPGYAIKGNEIYIIKNINGNMISSKVTPIRTITDISGSTNYCSNNIGEIFILYGKYYLCLDDKLHLEIDVQNNIGHYVIGNDVNSNSPLTSKSIISFTENYIISDNSVNVNNGNGIVKLGNDKYYAFSNFKGTYTLPSSSIGVMAYELIPGDNIYQINPNPTTPNLNTELFYCDDKNICSKSKGFITIPNGTGTILYDNFSSSKNRTEWNVYNSPSTCDTSETNKAIYISEKNELRICTMDGKTVSLIPNRKYFFEEMNGNYQQIIGNKGKSIIAILNAEDGYYLVKDNLISNNNEETTNKMIKCSSNVCVNNEASIGYYIEGTGKYIIECSIPDYSKTLSCKLEDPNPGFYIDSGNKDKIISCIKDNTKDSVTLENGYYISNEYNTRKKGIIKCTSNQSCNYYQVKSRIIILNSGINSSIYPLIECNPTNGCKETKGNIGHYISYPSSVLIKCVSQNSCTQITPTTGYYIDGSSNKMNTIIHCVKNSKNNTPSCSQEIANDGYYLTDVPDILIYCQILTGCRTLRVDNGIFRGATKISSSPLMESSYNMIRCINHQCFLLSIQELLAIPVCSYSSKMYNVCYINLKYSLMKDAVTVIKAGDICTSPDRSVVYFATDTIVVEPNVIDGESTTYTYTTTHTNCLDITNNLYDHLYFPFSKTIYRVGINCVLKNYKPGFYFIDVNKYNLILGNEISAYNEKDVKIYFCDEKACEVKSDVYSYLIDVGKRIFMYDFKSKKYSFAYQDDIICIYKNNQCTPNADLINREFCTNYKGELLIVKSNIKNRENGECHKVKNSNSSFYGYSKYLYLIDQFSAQRVDQTGYYITNSNFNNNNNDDDDGNTKMKNNLIIYGCINSSCTIYEPVKDIYYYNSIDNSLMKYDLQNGWITIQSYGYAYISLSPIDTSIYYYTKDQDKIKIKEISNGYYYTIDQKMYICNNKNMKKNKNDSECERISDTGYYFTNSREIYYCTYENYSNSEIINDDDNEDDNDIKCIKKHCVPGQYYYIDGNYYTCGSNSVLVSVKHDTCQSDENVIVNFPISLSNEYPGVVGEHIDNIQMINNVNMYLDINSKGYINSWNEDDSIKICSTKYMGYIDCETDDTNPDKCKISSSHILKPSISRFSYIITIILLIIYFNI